MAKLCALWYLGKYHIEKCEIHRPRSEIEILILRKTVEKKKEKKKDLYQSVQRIFTFLQQIMCVVIQDRGIVGPCSWSLGYVFLGIKMGWWYFFHMPFVLTMFSWTFLTCLVLKSVLKGMVGWLLRLVLQ